MTISFAGHSRVSFADKIKIALKEQLKRLLPKNEITVCYLGGYGDFDRLCASACREIKQEYGNIELVYVSPYMTPSEQEKVKQLLDAGRYDLSVYPPIEDVPPKFAIIKRNEWMMMNADVVLAYVNHSSGGAYRSLRFAKVKKKRVINIHDLIDAESSTQ